MLFKNKQTNESVNVSNLKMKDGRIFFSVRGKGCGRKFFNRNYMLAHDEDAPDGTYLKLRDGWELEKAPKAPKAKPAPTPKKKAEKKVEKKVEKEVSPTPAPAPTPAPKPAPKKGIEPTDEALALAKALIALKGTGACVDEEQVRQIVRQTIEEEGKGHEVVHTIKVAELPPYKLPKGSNPKLFETVLTMVKNDRIIGRYPWLYGPAGSGKSTMARMVADALGVPFYSVSSLQQKYELEGYTDAVGEFVQTAFFKAMKEGGVFCFDEISTTSGEVQVAFNTAAAQLVYNFPKVGMVTAHPDFHIIAADNSVGRGGDKRYISRFQLDASTLDRYNFVEVGYSEEHDLNMANGDKDLVEFIKAVRVAIENANTTYLATPRASKAIKALQACGMTDKDAVWYGLCSGWAKDDVRTIALNTRGSGKYFNVFKEIAELK